MQKYPIEVHSIHWPNRNIILTDHSKTFMALCYRYSHLHWGAHVLLSEKRVAQSEDVEEEYLELKLACEREARRIEEALS